MFTKKKKYQDEIKKLHDEKIENLKKEIEVLQEIICTVDTNVRKCANGIHINKEEISKINKKINERKENKITGYG